MDRSVPQIPESSTRKIVELRMHSESVDDFARQYADDIGESSFQSQYHATDATVKAMAIGQNLAIRLVLSNGQRFLSTNGRVTTHRQIPDGRALLVFEFVGLDTESRQIWQNIWSIATSTPTNSVSANDVLVDNVSGHPETSEGKEISGRKPLFRSNDSQQGVRGPKPVVRESVEQLPVEQLAGQPIDTNSLSGGAAFDADALTVGAPSVDLPAIQAASKIRLDHVTANDVELESPTQPSLLVPAPDASEMSGGEYIEESYIDRGKSGRLKWLFVAGLLGLAAVLYWLVFGNSSPSGPGSAVPTVSNSTTADSNSTNGIAANKTVPLHAISVESKPDGANIILNGKDTELITPAVVPDQPEGAVLDIAVDKVGYKRVHSSHTVFSDQSKNSVTIDIKVKAARQLRFTSEPLGATVTLDREPIGKTPLKWDRKVYKGRSYHVVMRMSGFKTDRQTFRYKALEWQRQGDDEEAVVHSVLKKK